MANVDIQYNSQSLVTIKFPTSITPVINDGGYIECVITPSGEDYEEEIVVDTHIRPTTITDYAVYHSTINVNKGDNESGNDDHEIQPENIDWKFDPDKAIKIGEKYYEYYWAEVRGEIKTKAGNELTFDYIPSDDIVIMSNVPYKKAYQTYKYPNGNYIDTHTSEYQLIQCDWVLLQDSYIFENGKYYEKYIVEGHPEISKRGNELMYDYVASNELVEDDGKYYYKAYQTYKYPNGNYIEPHTDDYILVDITDWVLIEDEYIYYEDKYYKKYIISNHPEITKRGDELPFEYIKSDEIVIQDNIPYIKAWKYYFINGTRIEPHTSDYILVGSDDWTLYDCDYMEIDGKYYEKYFIKVEDENGDTYLRTDYIDVEEEYQDTEQVITGYKDDYWADKTRFISDNSNEYERYMGSFAVPANTHNILHFVNWTSNNIPAFYVVEITEENKLFVRMTNGELNDEYDFTKYGDGSDGSVVRPAATIDNWNYHTPSSFPRFKYTITSDYIFITPDSTNIFLFAALNGGVSVLSTANKDNTNISDFSSATNLIITSNWNTFVEAKYLLTDKKYYYPIDTIYAIAPGETEIKPYIVGYMGYFTSCQVTYEVYDSVNKIIYTNLQKLKEGTWKIYAVFKDYGDQSGDVRKYSLEDNVPSDGSDPEPIWGTQIVTKTRIVQKPKTIYCKIYYTYGSQLPYEYVESTDEVEVDGVIYYKAYATYQLPRCYETVVNYDDYILKDKYVWTVVPCEYIIGEDGKYYQKLQAKIRIS